MAYHQPTDTQVVPKQQPPLGNSSPVLLLRTMSYGMEYTINQLWSFEVSVPAVSFPSYKLLLRGENRETEKALMLC